jgi:hypothetical protein
MGKAFLQGLKPLKTLEEVPALRQILYERSNLGKPLLAVKSTTRIIEYY